MTFIVLPAGDAFTRRAGSLEAGGALPQAVEAIGSAGTAALGGRARELEDAPGVPQQAWIRVAKGVPPAEPFTPGKCFAPHELFMAELEGAGLI
jgi:hypothetical protein